MAKPNRPERERVSDNQTMDYTATGHPSVEQLMADQSTGPIADASVLRGDFWPEDETIEEFLKTLHEWRGHTRTDPAA